MSKRRRSKSSKLQERKVRVKNKEIEIVNSNNEVDFSESKIEKVMKKNNVSKYQIDASGAIRMESDYDSWLIDADQRVVFLYHANSKNIRGGNDRSSYHLHNVFYDLEYTINSVIEHDQFKAKKYRGT